MTICVGDDDRELVARWAGRAPIDAEPGRPGMGDFYSKAWRSLSAVIVVLTWLWLAGIAVLFGAELDSEVEARAAAG